MVRANPEKRFVRALVSALLAVSSVGGLGISFVGCLSSEERGPETDACPSNEDFPLASQLLERRCGTIDCHGQPGRSFRIYGRYGLRQPIEAPPEGYVPGGMAPTTPEELRANLHSACGLEPELMNEVVTGKADVGTLTLVRKPRLTEAHKGGRVLPSGSDGDKCLTSWIKGMIDTTACNNELIKP